MEGILNFLFTYIFLILLWGGINLILFTSSYLLRKNFSSLTLILTYLIDFGIQLYLFGYALYIVWQIIVARQWLLLILAFVFGGFIIGWWQMIYGLLLTPFHFISNIFTTKVQELIDKPKEDFKGEYISSDGKVIGKFQSDDKTNKLLAKWFLISFGILFLHQFSTSVSREGYGFGWYIITPIIIMLIDSLVVSIFLGIWNLIKCKSFFKDGKTIFFTKCLKIISIIYVFSFITNMLFKGN